MGASNFSRATSLSSQLLAQRKIFVESQTGRSSFRKLLEPSLHQRPGIAPYRVILGNVKDKLMKTQQWLELFLEDLPCEHDPMEYYETTYQLLDSLLLCYDSLQSCGSGILDDGRLADLIKRLSTFGMILMKLDLHQESSRHAKALDVITRYLEMGVYSEWEEEGKLEFLTRELKGKRPLVPPTIEGDWNGVGAHTNYSTKSMREYGGYEVVKKATEKLGLRHKEHITAYGERNERRLTGQHETTDINTFLWGVANRGASIQLGCDTEKASKG